MPKQPKEKSSHLQELEAVFDRHTRRFSPFAILGLSSSEQDKDDPLSTIEEGGTSLPGEEIHPRVVEVDKETTSSLDPHGSGVAPTHMSVDPTHYNSPPTHMEEGGTSLPGEGIHPRVVEVDKETTSSLDPHGSGVAPTHKSLHHTHSLQSPVYPVYTDVRIHDVLAATQLKAQLGKKARQVLSYLNSIRSVERPAYTVPVGYAHISAAAAVHPHYLRRNVLPKLAMVGLIGIVHKSLQGTIYHLHYDASFLDMVVREDEESPSLRVPEASIPIPQLIPSAPELAATLPPWIDREHWEWLTPEIVRQLVAKAGSEAQAQEKLEMILYNETHGPVERRVRDRRSVLAYYLRTPQADIWPNDDGFETLVLRRARQERDQALQEKALAEEALHARQETAKARFLTSLGDAQLQWLKQEAKRRVDAQPDARFLTSRYLLYKAEENQLILEWMDRVDYGESVPYIMSEKSEHAEEAKTRR